MSIDRRPATASDNLDRWRRWLLLSGAAYACMVLLLHLGTALGQVPVLDGREILALAGAWARGEGTADPFYRAPLYPALIAALLQAGWPATLDMLSAQLLNLAVHVTSIWLVVRLAESAWSDPRAGLLAGALYAAYPVTLFFMGEPLDITLGIGLFLAALWFWFERRGGPWREVLAGILAGLAVAARPHFLAPVLAMMVLTPWLPDRRWTHALRFALGLAAVLASMATVNGLRSGQYEVMPTQGGYNLYAANGPGANGLYYVQDEALWLYDDYANPARAESRRRYARLTGQAADSLSDGELSSFWRRQALGLIVQDPAGWLGLEVIKLRALLHDAEAYNNKTYVYHKARNPLLAWNPLSWAWLLAAAGVALLIGFRRRPLLILAAVGAAYAAGVLLFYVSARFRLPLAPLACVAAGGLVTLPAALKRQPGLKALAPALAVLILGQALWPVSAFDERETFTEDRLLEARAEAVRGRPDRALDRLGEVLAEHPHHPRALDMDCAIRFNAVQPHPEQWPEVLPMVRRRCEEVAGHSAEAGWTGALAAWLLGDRDAALEAWRALASAPGPTRERALAMLVLAGDRAAPVLAPAERGESNDLLLFALWFRGDDGARKVLISRYPPAQVEAQRRRLATWFDIGKERPPTP